MPLFLIAKFIGDDVLKLTLKTASEMVYEKNHEQELESVDLMLINFVAMLPVSLSYYSVKMLTNEFREYSNESYEWLNEKWVGRALKRLNLIADKRRVASGIEVMLNHAKAKEKRDMFKAKECKNE